MRSMIFRSLTVALFFAGSACTGAETQAVTATPSPERVTAVGRIEIAVSSPPPKPVAPFSIPDGFEAELGRPPLVAHVGDRLVLIRFLRRCERISGPSGTITLPKLGTGTFTPPEPGYRSCDRWMDALDSAGARVWDSPTPLAHHSVTVLGDRLLATGEGGVTLYAVATGLTLGDATDRVIGREACVDAPNARVFVSDWDDRTRDAVVDLSTMQVRPAGSERCPVRPFTQCDEQTAVACFDERDERRPPTAPVTAFYEAATIRTATDEVLIGRRTRGRKLPMIVAIDPVTHTKRWSHVVPPPEAETRAAEDQLFPHRFVDIAGGRLFIEYDAWTSHPHLAAFDMKDGARLWDVPIDAFVPFTPTAERVYLNDRGALRVLDAKTGEP